MSAASGRLRIDRAGHHTSLQDSGRPSSRSLGIPRSGVVDRAANVRVNELVGNFTSAAVLETAGGLVVTAASTTVVATTSSPEPMQLEAGETIEVEPAAGQRWGYLAVSGGFSVPTVIGSRSRDHLSAMGPLAVLDGATLTFGGSSSGSDVTSHHTEAPDASNDAPIDLHRGPHAGQLGDIDQAIVSQHWTVARQQPREFVVLTGGELGATEWVPAWGFPLIEGAVTLADDGSLHVALCNQVTVTGRPVVGVVDPHDVGRIGQRLDGASCRFTARG